MTKGSRRNHSPAFKTKGALEALKEGATVADIAAKHSDTWRHRHSLRSAGSIRLIFTTNGWKNDIRSDNGRDCRNAFLVLSKICRKLGLSFWDFLGTRTVASLEYSSFCSCYEKREEPQGIKPFSRPALNDREWQSLRNICG